MKNIFYLTFIFLFASVSVFAQDGETIEVETFNTLSIKGSFNVILHTGESYLHFKDGSDINVKNNNGMLSIISKKGNKILQDLHIASPDLKNLNLDIDGDFTIDKKALFFSTLNFNANIRGETKLNLNGSVFAGNFNNCGKITIEGTVDKIYLNLSNSPHLHTNALQANSRSINHND